MKYDNAYEIHDYIDSAMREIRISDNSVVETGMDGARITVSQEESGLYNVSITDVQDGDTINILATDEYIYAIDENIYDADRLITGLEQIYTVILIVYWKGGGLKWRQLCQ